MSRPDTGSRTEADAGRYEAATGQDWRDDRPDWDDAEGLDRMGIAHPTATCGDCGQRVTCNGWCVTCSNERAAEMRQRDEEWWQCQT